jgi:fumarylacetoacetate (FAA) hydrolase
MPLLEVLYKELNDGACGNTMDFQPVNYAAPLPRAYQWVDGSAYVNHVELVRKARGATLPESFWRDPLVYQGGSDDFIGPRDPISFVDNKWGLDFEAEVAVVTDDVPMDTSAIEAGSHIKLVMLVNDVSLRELIPAELAKGFGFYHSKPATCFSPVAVTPDELGGNWHEDKVHLPLISQLNGQLFGKPNAGIDMTFSFSDLITHITKTRNLGAGTIVGSGTVSNKQNSNHGSSIADGGVGYSCIAELRTIETIRDGAPSTEFLQINDTVHIEMLDQNGHSIFGAINQRVA